MRRLLAGVLLVAALVAGCGDDDEPGDEPTTSTGPRPLSADEADRLAVTRFNNYVRELVPFTMTVPIGEQVITLSGRADMREHRAIAGFSASNPTEHGVLAWNFGTAGLLPTEAQPTDVELTQAAEADDRLWQTHPLDQGQPLDALLLVLLNLALDRPDNAQLLRQNGAEWQASTLVEGRDVDVMTATPAGAGQTLTYYVDAEGTLLRVDVAVAGPTPATISFPAGESGEVPVIDALGPAPDLEPSDETG